jgi:hypothetical protein
MSGDDPTEDLALMANRLEEIVKTVKSYQKKLLEEGNQSPSHPSLMLDTC